MELDAVTKMWVSFIAIGLMLAASALITFARLKTTGFVKMLLSLIAVILLFFAIVYGMLAIL